MAKTRTARARRKTSPTNVSTVPNRSPFRYPGGKTWLIPEIRKFLRSRPVRPEVLVEPFAGGAICSLTAVAERLVDRAVLVELDEDVAAVWSTIIHEDAEALVDRILNFKMTPGNLDQALQETSTGQLERAFATILRNRVNHGGILASGAGRMKAGENGRGLLSRWYPETLAARIREITTYRERLTVLATDGIGVLRAFGDISSAVAFIDPPYTAPGKRAGRRLYNHHELNHEALFDLASDWRGDILMTYDNSPHVREMAVSRGLQVEPVTMKSGAHARMTEALIGHDLSWLRKVQPPQLDVQLHLPLSA